MKISSDEIAFLLLLKRDGLVNITLLFFSRGEIISGVAETDFGEVPEIVLKDFTWVIRPFAVLFFYS